jgi:hypothetical protein
MSSINGMPVNKIDYGTFRNPYSSCMLDHAPYGSTRQEFLDLQRALRHSGIEDVGWGKDDETDEVHDARIERVARECASIRIRNTGVAK